MQYDITAGRIIFSDIMLQEIASPTPAIVFDGTSWTVCFDGRHVPTDSMQSFTLALEAWFSLFWVFSVEYPPCLKSSCLFIENYVIGHDCTVPAAVKRLASKILK